MSDHESLRSTYESYSPYKLRIYNCYIDECRWYDFIKAGFTREDLVLVMRWLQWQIKREKRRKESFRLYNLLDLERFQYDLEDARGWARRPQPTPKQQFLASVGRPEPEPQNCRPVSELIDELRKAAQ